MEGGSLPDRAVLGRNVGRASGRKPECGALIPPFMDSTQRSVPEGVLYRGWIQQLHSLQKRVSCKS